jgi:hypothetical protein
MRNPPETVEQAWKAFLLLTAENPEHWVLRPLKNGWVSIEYLGSPDRLLSVSGTLVAAVAGAWDIRNMDREASR